MKKSLIAMSCLGLLLSTGSLFGQGKGKGKGGGGDAAKGKMVFEETCSACHKADSEERLMGPGLKGLTKRPKLVNGEAMSDAAVTKFVNEGGNGMPAFGDVLSAPEKADILAYLKSL